MQAPWKVLNIELSEGVPSLFPETGYDGIYVIFWWHNIPLGHEEILAEQLPMPAARLLHLIVSAIAPAVGSHLLEFGFKGELPVVSDNPARDCPPDFDALMVLERPLSKLQGQPAASIAGTISIIICTRDRPEALSRCLKSLQQLTEPPFEIIVVDNAPRSDATQQVVEQMPDVRYVLEPRAGLSVARNTGIRHSTGELLAFTDDDVIVHPYWIEHLRRGFLDPQVMAVTGLMLPAELETEAQLIFHKGGGGPGWNYQPLLFDTQFFEEMRHRGVPVWRIGAGANMAFRRTIFDRVGYFDERLGAGASGCSEDSEFWYRVLAAGWFCRFESTAAVYHYHRRDLESLREQAFQYMQGHVAALLIQFANYGHWGNLRRLFLTLPKFYGRSLWRSLLYSNQPQHSTLGSEILGCLAGVRFYLQHSGKTKGPAAIGDRRSAK